jgi:hypothetical protein
MLMMKSNFAANKVILTRKLGIARRTLYNFEKLSGAPKPRSDGRHDVNAWKRFVSGRAEQITIAGMQLSQIEQARLERLRVTTAREKFKLDVESGKFIAVEDANRQVDTANGIVRRSLQQLVENEIPARCAGMSPIEIKKTGVRLLNECLELLCAELKAETF